MPSRSAWKDPVVLATAAMTTVLALPLVLPILPLADRAAYSDTSTTAPFLLFALAIFQRRLVESSGQERRFWGAMLAGTACWLGERAVVIASYLVTFTFPADLLGDLFYVGLYAFLVLALDTHPHRRPGPDHRGLLSALQRTGAVVFVFGALVYLVLVPAALDPESYWLGIPSFTFYVMLDGYLVLRLIGALLETTDRRWRLVYRWLLITCAAWLVLDTVEALMWTEVLPWVNGGTPLDLPWLVPLVALVMTGHAPVFARGGNVAPEEPEAAIEKRSPFGSSLILMTILVPLLHFVVYGFGLFGESTRRAHEIVALVLLVILGSLVFAYQHALERRNRSLEKERREALARIEHQALHDPLTGLPNRRLLEDRVAQGIAQAERRGERLAILFFDLDRFKAINDTSGHSVGDQILQQIGERMASRVRSSDTLARVGGDEFVVMATNLTTREAALRLATDIHQSLEEPFESDGTAHTVSASVGVSLYPEDGHDLAALLRCADRAMYRAKATEPGEAPSANTLAP